MLAIVWDILDTHDTSEIGFTFILECLVVILIIKCSFLFHEQWHSLRLNLSAFYFLGSMKYCYEMKVVWLSACVSTRCKLWSIWPVFEGILCHRRPRQGRNFRFPTNTNNNMVSGPICKAKVTFCVGSVMTRNNISSEYATFVQMVECKISAVRKISLAVVLLQITKESSDLETWN
jgi:hypothetical protein